MELSLFVFSCGTIFYWAIYDLRKQLIKSRQSAGDIYCRLKKSVEPLNGVMLPENVPLSPTTARRDYNRLQGKEYGRLEEIKSATTRWMKGVSRSSQAVVARLSPPVTFSEPASHPVHHHEWGLLLLMQWMVIDCFLVRSCHQ